MEYIGPGAQKQRDAHICTYTKGTDSAPSHKGRAGRGAGKRTKQVYNHTLGGQR